MDELRGGMYMWLIVSFGWGTIVHEAEEISRALQNPTHSCFKPTTMIVFTHICLLYVTYFPLVAAFLRNSRSSKNSFIP